MATEYFGKQLGGLALAGAGAYAVNQSSKELENIVGDYGTIALGIGVILIYLVYSKGNTFPLPDDLLLALGIVLVIAGIESI